MHAAAQRGEAFAAITVFGFIARKPDTHRRVTTARLANQRAEDVVEESAEASVTDGGYRGQDCVDRHLRVRNH